ncbi:hypothetical protein F190043G2_18830 [Blautia caecimuris]|uniref:hypothetical protein n=1 Tax=Blautia caecimuris TaxID=1796615 RepID=UPI0034B5D701
MKNRQAAILTGMFLCMAAVTGCGSNTETQAAKQQGSEIEDTAAENTAAENTAAEGDDEKTDGKTGKTEEQNKENQIFGKIVSVSEDSITISVESAPVNGTEDGKENSGTEETGEEQTIALTENTVIRKQTMGQPGGEAPEMPEGEAPENGGASEQPEEVSENGGTSEQPEEVSENGGTSEQPEKPEGEAPAQEAGEEIVWSDLKEGDMAVIILDEDGNAESVSIMEGDMGQPGDDQSQRSEEYQAETAYTDGTETADTETADTETDNAETDDNEADDAETEGEV